MVFDTEAHDLHEIVAGFHLREAVVAVGVGQFHLQNSGVGRAEEQGIDKFGGFAFFGDDLAAEGGLGKSDTSGE